MQRQAGRWFAVYVRPKLEASVGKALSGKGYECFLPTYARNPTGSKIISDSQLPLFPGYVFCRLDSDRRPLIVTTPGVIRIVGYGGVPAAIDDDEMVSLRKVVQSGIPVKPLPKIQIGNLLVITSGPLAGVVGVLHTVNQRHQLVISVSLLGRSVLVEIQPEWVGSPNVECMGARSAVFVDTPVDTPIQ